MPLKDTYAQSVIHDDWRGVYRKDPRQLAFDDAIYQWLFSHIQPQGGWLDAGCGSGEHTIRLAQRSPKVLAFDISNEIIAAAKSAAERMGVADRIEFVPGPLEELPAGQPTENVHCRGVLMHIPDWRTVLVNLCRNVRPGGYLVICEGDRHSVESALIRLVRMVLPTRSRMESTEGGLEFWSEINGKPFLVRMADIGKLEEEMRRQGVEPQFRKSIFLIDLNRFPATLRGLGIAINRLWFRLGLPLGAGVMLVGQRPA